MAFREHHLRSKTGTMKTAKEYWKDFPKHNPPKDVDITEAMNEFASIRVEEETKENQRLKNDLLDALDLKEGNGPTALSMLSERVKQLTETNRQLCRGAE
jgi:hypothetical protein